MVYKNDNNWILIFNQVLIFETFIPLGALHVKLAST